MVDINLIGDDQDQFEEEDNNEQEYQDNFDSDVSGSPQNDYLGGGIDPTDYTNVLNKGGGSKKLVYILVGCSAILLLVVGYFLMNPGKGKKVESEQSTQAVEKDVPDDTIKTTSIEAPEKVVEEIPAISPVLKQRMELSYSGIKTVGDIMSSLSSGVNFTMVTYSDGKFLLEFLAKNSADIDKFSNQLQQVFYSSDIKVLSRNRRSVQGYSYQKALINGSVNIGQDAGNLSINQEPTFYNPAELKHQLSTICQRIGLQIKQFDSAEAKNDGEFITIPIHFRTQGTRTNIMNFLQALLNENMNISFSKISLIANDVDLTDPNITLVLNISLYRMG